MIKHFQEELYRRVLMEYSDDKMNKILETQIHFRYFFHHWDPCSWSGFRDFVRVGRPLADMRITGDRPDNTFCFKRALENGIKNLSIVFATLLLKLDKHIISFVFVKVGWL